MSCEKPGTPPAGLLFCNRRLRRNGGSILAFLRHELGPAELQGLNMLSGQSRPESGQTRLPLSTWVIPVITCVIVLLAVAAALA
jgi:hypothetical protein